MWKQPGRAVWEPGGDGGGRSGLSRQVLDDRRWRAVAERGMALIAVGLGKRVLTTALTTGPERTSGKSGSRFF